MTEDTTEQEALTTAKCQRRLFHSVAAFAFLCIAASAVLLVIVFVLFIEDCVGCRSFLAQVLGTAAAALFIVALLMLLTIVFCKRRSGRQNSLAPSAQVVVSSIPAEDLEKSPAPFLPYNHVPHRQPFVITSSIELPDYFTVAQKIYEVYSSEDAEFWAEDPGTPPPTYKQALEMTTLAATTSQEDARNCISKLQGCTEDTRL